MLFFCNFTTVSTIQEINNTDFINKCKEKLLENYEILENENFVAILWVTYILYILN